MRETVACKFHIKFGGTIVDDRWQYNNMNIHIEELVESTAFLIRIKNNDFSAA